MSEKLSNLDPVNSTGSGDKYYVVQNGESKKIDFDNMPFPVVGEETGNVLDLSNVIGNYYNMSSASSSETYTYENEVVGGIAKTLVNSSNEPTVAGAYKISGDNFEPNENTYLNVWFNGNRVEYWFTKISDSIDFESSLLFLSSPTPRQEISNTDNLDLFAIGENADSIEFFYKDDSNNWISIGQGLKNQDVFSFSGFTPTNQLTSIKAVATYSDSSTREVQNNVFCLKIVDTFTDVNGTSILSHTPDNLFGNGWFVESGNWEIQNNTLQINTPDSVSGYRVYVDANSTDVVFKLNVPVLPSVATTQIILRYLDSLNYVLLIIFTDGRVSIIEVNNGINDTLFSESAGFFNTSIDIQVWISDNTFNLIFDDVPLASVSIPNQLTGTKFGFQRAGSDDTPSFDNVTIIPLTEQVINNSVNYNSTKSNLRIIEKGDNAPYDSDGILDFDIFTSGSTNHLVYAAFNSDNTTGGLCYATSSTSDPHNWNINTGYILSFPDRSVAGCSIYFDGSIWHVVYSNRDVGTLHYANGISLNSLVEVGVIKDLTSQGLYLRQSSIHFENNTFYLVIDVRYDQPSGEFGYIGVMSGTSLISLGDVSEILSTPAYSKDMCDLTTPSVRYNENNNFYEMFYSGYTSRNGNEYPHDINLAISKNIQGVFERIQKDPVIPSGESVIDNNGVGSPCRMKDTNFIYYQFNSSDVSGGADGLTYTTFS